MTRRNALLAIAAAIAWNTVSAEERAAVDDRYKWNLTEIYASEAAWNQNRTERVFVYASLRHDLDTRDGRGQQMREQAREARVAFRTAEAWIRPAILALGDAKVRKYIASDPRLAEVSTLAHESGRSMHSYLAARAQPYATWRYWTFIAEVASTLNENLLLHTMLADASSDAERLFLPGSELELLRTYYGAGRAGERWRRRREALTACSIAS